jgi:hypothetical protein
MRFAGGWPGSVALENSSVHRQMEEDIVERVNRR